MSDPVTIDTITQPQLLALAIAHIHRFSNLIDGAKWRTGVRVDECKRYLALWRGVYVKAVDARVVTITKAKLTRDERNEIDEALECGDYDKLLEDTAYPS